MSSIPTVTLGADLTIPRVINGLWQAAGGHGEINEEAGTKHVRILNKFFAFHYSCFGIS